MNNRWWPTGTASAYHVRIYNRVLGAYASNADEIDRGYRAALWRYRYAFLMGMPWYERLCFWLKETWLVLIGKRRI